MRSALTDPPVASFTTLLIGATQHATGLMVKVAWLLPSRDLLSSQRRLRWTHTKGLAKCGQTNNVLQLLVLCFIISSGGQYSIEQIILTWTVNKNQHL